MNISSSLGANSLIFWSGDDTDIHSRPQFRGNTREKSVEDVPEDNSNSDADVRGESECRRVFKRPSAYVELFETMVNTVVTHEAHLLSPRERSVLERFSVISYNARYLLVRLSLRKADKWHRLSSLKYHSEIGNKESIVAAIRELSWDPRQETNRKLKEETEREVIDLTLDDDDSTPLHFKTDGQEVVEKPASQSKAGPSRSGDTGDWIEQADFTSSTSTTLVNCLDIGWNSEPDIDLTTFAHDESKMSLLDLLECLTTDELKTLARKVKIKSTQNRPTLISAFLTFSSTQTMIPFLSNNQQIGFSSCYVGDKRKYLRIQAERLREMILNIIGKCIRINTGLLKLFRRVDLIYFRSTEYTQTLLTSALLVRFRKRFYPSYEYTRTTDIWRTRDELLAYEKALELEACIGGMIDGTTEISVCKQAYAQPVSTPTPKVIEDDKVTFPAEAEQGDEDLKKEEDAKLEHPKVLNARRVREVFLRCVYPCWKDLVRTGGMSARRWESSDTAVVNEGSFKMKAEDQGYEALQNGAVDGCIYSDSSMRSVSLDRFDCGHVYTRIVHRCLHVLATLKEHALELEVLENLLSQRRWRKGRRGRWHERRALILMTYCGKEEAAMRRAMDAVVEGLDDVDTHIIYRPMLVRRLARIEKKLQIPPEERHHCEGALLEPHKVYLEGVRLGKMPQGFSGGNNIHLNGRGSATPVTSGPVSNAFGGVTPGSPKPEGTSVISTKDTGRIKHVATTEKERGWWKGKSIWQGRGGEEINVETFALQYYENFGYKGFHSEGSIVRTLFGLLFFDIIFASIPGAFETPYQSAPLDIAEDGFYYARKDSIEIRLLEIETGAAKDILERVDAEHREKGTWCVGVRWDLFGRQELIEIVQCLGSKQLAAICRLFCEDYAARGAGVPDLFIWNAKSGVCKFVEVKGPGDSLQENQKLWINLLLRFGVPVEVCHVREKGLIAKKKKTNGPVDKTGRDVKRAKVPGAVSDSDYEAVFEYESFSKKRRVN